MQMDPRLNCEYERAYPRTQPYSRLPYDKRAEKAWWADYYRRNRTFLTPFEPMREDAFFSEAGQRPLLQDAEPKARLQRAFCFWAGKRRASCLRECAGALFVFYIM